MSFFYVFFVEETCWKGLVVGGVETGHCLSREVVVVVHHYSDIQVEVLTPYLSCYREKSSIHLI